MGQGWAVGEYGAGDGVGGRGIGDFFEVGTGAESGVVAVEDADPLGRVRIEGAEGIQELLGCGGVDGVAAVGAGEGNGCDAVKRCPDLDRICIGIGWHSVWPYTLMVGSGGERRKWGGGM